MKPYGLKKPDRLKCVIKGCHCGEQSSKHPIEGHKDGANRRLKKHARQLSKKTVVEEQHLS